MAFPTNATAGDLHQPAPPTGPSYVYRGGGRWDLYVDNSATDMSNYYTKAQVDGTQGTQDTNITAAAGAAAAAQATANAAIPTAQKGAVNGVASLDASGYVPAGQLANVPAAPVSSVAGRTGAVTLAKADVGLANVDNTSDAAKPVSTATQTALDGKQPLATNLTSWAAIAPASKLDGSAYTAADVKTKLLTVDGAGSTIDADQLDGYHAASFVLTVNGSGPDGAGNVTVAAGVQDVRLGASSMLGPSNYTNPTACTAGYVVTKQEQVDISDGYYRSPGTQRPIQKQVSGTWTTVSQV